MTNVYINIAMVGSVNQVLWNLLTQIKDSGLQDFVNKIYLVFNGQRNLLRFDLVSDKYEIIEANGDISKCEFPTLDLIWKHSQELDMNVLYLHTKGVTKPDSLPVQDWTQYLSYFNIQKWQDRIKELDHFSCTGVNLGGNPQDIFENPGTWGYGKAPMHYSGNFWWSKSSHIKRLPNPIDWIPTNDFMRWRVMPEMWVCQLTDANYNSAFSSGVNHYVTRFPKEMYEFQSFSNN